MAAIFTASSLPARDIPSIFSFQDVVFHAIIYALLGAVLLRALFFSLNDAGIPALLLLSVLAATVYGISDEFHQYFVPGRCASGWDVFIDMIGSSCGAAVAAFFYRTYGTRKTL